MGRKTKGDGRGRKRETARTLQKGQSSRMFIPSDSDVYHSYDPGLDLPANRRPHLSLQEEARNTERRQFWRSDLKLRHSQVNFINAGRLKPEGSTNPKEVVEDSRPSDEEKILQGEALAKLDIQDGLPYERPDSTINAGASQVLSHPLVEKQVQEHIEKESNQKRSLELQRCTQSAKNSLHEPNTMLYHSESPSPSDSGEEVILFTGRKYRRKKPTSKTTLPTIPDGSFLRGTRSVASADRTNLTIGDHLRSSLHLGYSDLPPIHKQHSNFQSYQRQKVTTQSEKDPFEDDILADYILHMEDSNDDEELVADTATTEPEGTTMLGGTNSNSAKAIANMYSQDSANEANLDLSNFDSISTSSGDHTVVRKVFAKRSRPSGIQYLVTTTDSKTHEARWLPLRCLKTLDAKEQIALFEAKNLSDERFFTTYDDCDVTNTQQDSIDIGDERNKTWATGMTDEKMAQLLSKQEQLGLGSDQLLLFDGDLVSNDQQDLSIMQQINRNKGGLRSKNNQSLGRSLPGIQALTPDLSLEPYNSISNMEYNRSSLRTESKHRRTIAELTFANTDLDDHLQQAWNKDRAKKKARKQEREELRRLGLLGISNKTDLRSVYHNGISSADIAEEVEHFLFSSSQSLLLPPMGHKERKRLHMMANILKIRSKSMGEGESRFPILYKTARSQNHDVATVEALFAGLKWQPTRQRPSKGPWKFSGGMRKTRDGGSSAAVSYRDGEVVGAAAPVLGQENKGRAMLEKMGWSTGTALGALNNKGIMEPVTHVVKTTKAGLG